MRKEFKSAEDLRLLVFQALSEFKSRRRSHTAARPAHTDIPHNLPRLQPFFGREDELANIREALEPDNRTWGALVDGPGGMGKTSLAVRAAYDCTPEQFDRIVFVSVKNRELDDTGVREVGDFLIPGFLELLNELARRLDRADILKEAEDRRLRLLNEALRDVRALLILDNLESLPRPDRDRLFTFVKRLPPGCKALLTSREPFGNTGDGFKLERLSQDAALDMLEELAGHSRQLARTAEAERVALYEQTSGNPLLLRWVAGQLGRGRCRTLSDALGFLRSGPQGNDALEFVFGDMLNDFTEDETKVLCALTHFTLPAKVEHVAPVAGCGDDATDDALSTLINRSLVIPNTEETAFTLVPMVADFLRRRKPEVVADTGDRLAERVYTLAIENGFQKFDNFPMLEAAWPMVAAALPHFLTGPNDRLQTVCDALPDFLNFTGRWDEWLALSTDAEEMAVRSEDFVNAGWRAYYAGWTQSLRNQLTEVLVCADRAEAYWCKDQDRVHERGIAISLRGICHQLAEDYPAAIAAHHKVVELWRSINPESEDLSRSLNSLAEAERLSGNLEDAERNYFEALRIARAIDYHSGIATYISNLAALALARKDWHSGETLASEALVLTQKIGRKEAVAFCHYCLSLALIMQGRKLEALPNAKRAVEIFTELRSSKLSRARELLADCES